MSEPTHFVYVLRSMTRTGSYYVGRTTDVHRRISEHNAGKCKHTEKYRPWELSAFIAFPDSRRAITFERYLKSGSGRAFARRHFQ